MDKLAQVSFETPSEKKSISVIQGDIKCLDFDLDLMLVSAFYRYYEPTPGTMIGALNDCGISIKELSSEPEIDLRQNGNIWLSRKLSSSLPICRIGCVELTGQANDEEKYDHRSSDVPQIIRSFFKLIELAASMGTEIESLGLIVPGTGKQKIDEDLVIVPLLNECLLLLKNNESVKNIYIIERDPRKAEKVAVFLNASYSVFQKTSGSLNNQKDEAPLAFISYSKPDKIIADSLCSKLESNEIRVWYAPRDVDTPDYATSIVNAISRATHFIVILSHDSLMSSHVLNEVDLAFQELNRKIRFFPIKIDSEVMPSAFKYYLSRQHWMDATYPPLEKRLDEFVKKIKSGL